MLDKKKYITVTIKVILTIGIFLFLFLKIPFSKVYSRPMGAHEILEIFGIILALILISLYSSFFIADFLYRKEKKIPEWYLAGVFSLIAILIIIVGPIFKNFYLGIGLILVLIILSITTILISRGLTVLCKRKFLSIFIAFLNGILSSFLFSGLMILTYVKIDRQNVALGWLILIGSFIVGILSIIINIFIVVKKNWKRRI